jgi:hypothetical protein
MPGKVVMETTFFDGQLSIIYKGNKILNTYYLITAEIQLSRVNSTSKWLVYLVIPSSRFFEPIFKQSTLNEFLDLFAKNYLITKWLLYKMNFPHQMLINSIYNVPNESIKVCEKLLKMYHTNNYYFVDFKDLLIENTPMVGCIVPDYFFFREHMNSTSKLSDMLSYDNSGLGSLLHPTSACQENLPFKPLSKGITLILLNLLILIHCFNFVSFQKQKQFRMSSPTSTLKKCKLSADTTG